MAKTNLTYEYEHHFHYTVDINNIEASWMCQLTTKDISSAAWNYLDDN